MYPDAPSLDVVDDASHARVVGVEFGLARRVKQQIVLYTIVRVSCRVVLLTVSCAVCQFRVCASCARACAVKKSNVPLNCCSFSCSQSMFCSRYSMQ
jgi:hypothetical protein